jgi:hypothetical protein
MLSLHYNITNPDSKCNWVMDSLFAGWPGAYKPNYNVYYGHPAAFWGFINNNWHVILQHVDNDMDWWFWDMPYWGRWNGLKEALVPEQKFYWRVSKNSIHETKIKPRPDDRFREWNLNIKPWRNTGSEILVCPSSDTMTRWCTGQGEKEWTESVVQQLKHYTDRPVRVRYKPRTAKTSGPAAAQLVGLKSFQEDIADAWAVVTSVSMCAVEAISQGVPVFCDPHSFAVPVAETQISMIEQPKRIDVTSWFNHLAYCQFTQQEIKSGLAHRILTE